MIFKDKIGPQGSHCLCHAILRPGAGPLNVTNTLSGRLTMSGTTISSVYESCHSCDVAAFSTSSHLIIHFSRGGVTGTGRSVSGSIVDMSIR